MIGFDLSRTLRPVTAALVLALLLGATPTPSSAIGTLAGFDTIGELTTPWRVQETWEVINGYNSHPCHHRPGQQPEPTMCGDDEYYGFDLKPRGVSTGDWPIFAPLNGRISLAKEWPGAGYLVKLDTLDGRYRVNLYHLKSVQVRAGDTVAVGKFIGNVWDQHPNGKHLHMHLSDLWDSTCNPPAGAPGCSIPMRIAGRLYWDLGGTNQWKGEAIRDNAAFDEPGYSGEYRVLASSEPRPGTFNNRTSSLQLNEGCVASLYDGEHYQGRSLTLYGSTDDLAGHDFDNLASSGTLSCSISPLHKASP